MSADAIKKLNETIIRSGQFTQEDATKLVTGTRWSDPAWGDRYEPDEAVEMRLVVKNILNLKADGGRVDPQALMTLQKFVATRNIDDQLVSEAEALMWGAGGLTIGLTAGMVISTRIPGARNILTSLVLTPLAGLIGGAIGYYGRKAWTEWDD